MAAYELIGQTLAHSFSKQIHEALGAYSYALRELPNEAALKAYLHKREFSGCNVTLPYKQAVLPLCDALDPHAAAIGAVNTILNQNGRLVGYNTDYDGFSYLLARKNISLKGKTLLLLGAGGTAKTVTAVAQHAGAARVLLASRQPGPGQFSYAQARQQKQVQVLINTSPVGMFPQGGPPLVDVADFPALEAVVDVVYNPLKTQLLLQAQALGLPAVGGLPMLVEQAVAAARLYTGRSFGHADTERILHTLYAQLANLVLIGMPSSGKSKLGRAAAHKLHKPFVDLDRVLEQRAGKSIPEIFSQDGEEAFRKLESAVLADETKLPGRVLATGGGVVTRPQNIPLLRQNGVVLFLHRPLQNLQVGRGRPLSQSPDALAKMQAVRLPLYLAAADASVPNEGAFMRTVHLIVEAFHAALSP